MNIKTLASIGATIGAAIVGFVVSNKTEEVLDEKIEQKWPTVTTEPKMEDIQAPALGGEYPNDTNEDEKKEDESEGS